MKLLAQTTGNFMLFNTKIGVEVPEEGIGLVVASQWVAAQINQGQLQILSSGLSDDVTSEEVQDVFNQFERKIEPTVEYFEESHPYKGPPVQIGAPHAELDSVLKQIARERSRAKKRK